MKHKPPIPGTRTDLQTGRETSDLPGGWLGMAAAKAAGRAALIRDGEMLHYGALEHEVSHFSRGLLPLAAGQVVGVTADNPRLVLLALHAAARLGLALLPLDSRLPDTRQALIRQSGCRLVVSELESLDLPPQVHRLTPAEVTAARGNPEVIQPPPPPSREPQKILLIVPTSGSSGVPKGVMLSAANLAASARQVNHRFGLGADDRWLNCLPLQHIGGLAILYRCACAAATVVLHQGFDAERIWHDLSHLQVSHLSLVPAMLGRLLDVADGRRPPPQLRLLLIGGGPLAPALAERAHRAGWPLVVSYGMSETGSLCLLDDGPGAGLQPGQVGRPLAGFRISLSDEQAGEIRLAGPALMSGYANPELQPGEGLQQGWFNSGDLGSRDAQGRYLIRGRVDDLLNSGGRQLHPREVEQLLEACPAVHEVAVSGRPDPLWGERVVALYVGEVGEAALDAWARSHLPKALRPREFRRTDSLPRNPMGKLDRRAIRQRIG